MPNIDLRENKEGFAIIETIYKKFAGITKREISKVYLAQTVQHRIGHPPDERFREMMSLGKNGLQNYQIIVSDLSNASDFRSKLSKDSWDNHTGH